MPSFRSPAAQAEKAVGRALALGESRHESRHDGRIHSVGTARVYESALTGAARWLQDQGERSGLQHMTTEQAQAYLSARALEVGQKTLDLDRQALRVLPNVDREALERVHSRAERPPGLAEQSRTYTPAQRELVHQELSERARLAAEVVHAAGLRAHELLTLRPAAEQPASDHRQWSAERFTGRENHARYTVDGKGGLVREVAIPAALAARLEAQRLDTPRDVTDRGVHYQAHYAIPAGQTLSSAWSAASNQALGWSAGLHGLRHSYAQERMGELQGQGQSYPDALATVSQEMGHFRADITEVYLR